VIATTPSNANVATMAIITVDVFVVVISLSPLYGWMQRVFEALAAGVPTGHPLASACCCKGIVTTASTITTPSNVNDATIAITA
jgi:hypothetical protein